VAGYHGHLAPWDAVWGMRHAVVQKYQPVDGAGCRRTHPWHRVASKRVDDRECVLEQVPGHDLAPQTRNQ
jgi:hypothetical protein